jgi:hypothetical protein
VNEVDRKSEARALAKEEKFRVAALEAQLHEDRNRQAHLAQQQQKELAGAKAAADGAK